MCFISDKDKTGYVFYTGFASTIDRSMDGDEKVGSPTDYSVVQEVGRTVGRYDKSKFTYTSDVDPRSLVTEV